MRTTKKTNWWFILILIGGIAPSLACGVLSPSSLPSGDYSLLVINGTGEPLCSLFIQTASSHPQKSGDLLGGTALESGGSFEITGLKEGYYDVHGKRCSDPSGPGYGRGSIPVLTNNAEWTLMGSSQ